MKTKTKPKILLFDIESGPLTIYSWGTYETDSLKVIKDWELLCFSYKWLGGKTRVISQNMLRRGGFRGKIELGVVKKLWEVLDEAEIVVGHNLDKFDIKKSNAKFIEYGLTPPSPYKTIDTLKIARRHFKFTSNKLDSLGEYLGVGRKVSTGGFELWDKCLQGDQKSWKLMERYNKNDTDLLEKVYLKLRPWSSNHPNIGCLVGKAVCPICGEKNLQKRGFSITSKGKIQRVQCQNCSGWSTIGGVIKLTNIK
jgi:DNA polymerase elongation subunit (family B)